MLATRWHFLLTAATTISTAALRYQESRERYRPTAPNSQPHSTLPFHGSRRQFLCLHRLSVGPGKDYAFESSRLHAGRHIIIYFTISRRAATTPFSPLPILFTVLHITCDDDMPHY